VDEIAAIDDYAFAAIAAEPRPAGLSAGAARDVEDLIDAADLLLHQVKKVTRGGVGHAWLPVSHRARRSDRPQRVRTWWTDVRPEHGRGC